MAAYHSNDCVDGLPEIARSDRFVESGRLDRLRLSEQSETDEEDELEEH
ncbi:MAG: hypothetical protein GY847_22820 [Proteobacteria bacterium]|nr:hypothetical protein [Pseudomonadota bacterium]